MLFSGILRKLENTAASPSSPPFAPLDTGGAVQSLQRSRDSGVALTVAVLVSAVFFATCFNFCRGRVSKFVSKILNEIELATGIDLDGDGDVGIDNVPTPCVS